MRRCLRNQETLSENGDKYWFLSVIPSAFSTVEQVSMINAHKILRICSVKSVTCYPVHSNVSDSALFIRQDHFMPCQVPLYSHYSVVRCCFHPVYIVLCCVVNNGTCTNFNQTWTVTRNTYLFNNLSEICQLPGKCAS